MDNHIIKNKEEVEAFLRQFLPKMDIWGIILIDRKKNMEAMAALGITFTATKEIIKDIHTIDYVETIINVFSYGDMWVFGKDIDGKEIYVKVAMGRPNTSTICISFHLAEHPLRYPFKDNKDNKGDEK